MNAVNTFPFKHFGLDYEQEEAQQWSRGVGREYHTKQEKWNAQWMSPYRIDVQQVKIRKY